MWNMLKKMIALKLAAKAAEKAGRWSREKKRRKARARRGRGWMTRGRGKRAASDRRARIAGGILGGALSFLAVYALRSIAGRRKGSGVEPYAQSGQAPSRTHIRLASHPAAQAR